MLQLFLSLDDLLLSGLILCVRRHRPAVAEQRQQNDAQQDQNGSGVIEECERHAECRNGQNGGYDWLDGLKQASLHGSEDADALHVGCLRHDGAKDDHAKETQPAFYVHMDRRVPEMREGDHADSADQHGPAGHRAGSVTRKNMPWLNIVDRGRERGSEAENQGQSADCKGIQVSMRSNQEGSGHDKQQNQNFNAGRHPFIDEHIEQKDQNRRRSLQNGCCARIRYLDRKEIYQLTRKHADKGKDDFISERSAIPEDREYLFSAFQRNIENRDQTREKKSVGDQKLRIKAVMFEQIASHDAGAAPQGASRQRHENADLLTAVLHFCRFPHLSVSLSPCFV